LRKAHLGGAQLEGAILSEAVYDKNTEWPFDDEKMRAWRRQNRGRRRELREPWFYYDAAAQGAYALMPGGDLREANLNQQDLQASDLRAADLRGAHMWRASLRDADLREADLRRADLRGADLTGARLEGVVVDEHTRWPAKFLRR
jgi:uncharacterized protein YjbI with pentapeptide repeats